MIVMYKRTELTDMKHNTSGVTLRVYNMLAVVYIM